jgi:hypothetical protein
VGTTPTPGVPPLPDDNYAACDAPANAPYRVLERSGTVLGQPWHVDMNHMPNGDTWVCLRAGTVGKRVIVAGANANAFKPDLGTPFPYQERQIPLDGAGQSRASATCQDGVGGTKHRVVNADVGATHLWLYAWEESPTRTHVCARGQTPASGNPPTAGGGRLTVDTTPGNPALVSHDTGGLGPCDGDIFSDNGPPPSALKYHIGNTTTEPSWVCTQVGGLFNRVKVDPNGSPATFTPDT